MARSANTSAHAKHIGIELAWMWPRFTRVMVSTGCHAVPWLLSKHRLAQAQAGTENVQ
jgi:hypothetical protein